MKVVFLDIDGVCNNGPYIQRHYKRCGDLFAIDQKNIMQLNRLTDTIEVGLVIPSMWRHYDNERPQGIKATTGKSLRDYLYFNGVRAPVIGETPDLSVLAAYGIASACCRGAEIQKWLETHYYVEKFVILDDDDDMDKLLPFLVQTDLKLGLCEEHVEKAIEMLR